MGALLWKSAQGRRHLLQQLRCCRVLAVAAADANFFRTIELQPILLHLPLIVRLAGAAGLVL